MSWSPEHFSDLGNAGRLVKRHGADMRHCLVNKTWYVWDGKRWASDETGEAVRRAKEAVRNMYRQAGEMLERASEITDDDERKKAVDHATRLKSFAVASESRSSLDAMLKLAETELPIPVTLDQLDAEPWLLNMQNGTLDLRTGELREHDRGDLITRICPVAYDPDARDERWDLFVKQTMPDEDLRRYVQKALGYSVTGTGTEGGMFLPYGPTHSGKTTLLEAVKVALGDYALAMDVETLTGSKRQRDGARPRYDLVRLFGSRVVISTEVPAGVKLDEALVKKLTGGDSLVARGLYARNGQESSGTFVIWLGSNYRPAVRDDDDAIWNRVKQIPFNEQHAGEARDPSVQPYFKKDQGAQAAVLAWLVDGAQLYLKEGLKAPETVVSLTDDYRREMNPLTAWLEECCDLGDGETTYHALRASYEGFTRRGDRPVGSKRFSNSLSKVLGVEYDRSRRVYTGIQVHQEPSESAQLPNEGQIPQTSLEGASRRKFVENGQSWAVGQQKGGGYGLAAAVEGLEAER